MKPTFSRAFFISSLPEYEVDEKSISSQSDSNEVYLSRRAVLMTERSKNGSLGKFIIVLSASFFAYILHKHSLIYRAILCKILA